VSQIATAKNGGVNDDNSPLKALHQGPSENRRLWGVISGPQSGTVAESMQPENIWSLLKPAGVKAQLNSRHIQAIHQHKLWQKLLQPLQRAHPHGTEAAIAELQANDPQVLNGRSVVIATNLSWVEG